MKLKYALSVLGAVVLLGLGFLAFTQMDSSEILSFSDDTRRDAPYGSDSSEELFFSNSKRSTTKKEHLRDVQTGATTPMAQHIMDLQVFKHGMHDDPRPEDIEHDKEFAKKLQEETDFMKTVFEHTDLNQIKDDIHVYKDTISMIGAIRMRLRAKGNQLEENMKIAVSETAQQNFSKFRDMDDEAIRGFIKTYFHAMWLRNFYMEMMWLLPEDVCLQYVDGDYVKNKENTGNDRWWINMMTTKLAKKTKLVDYKPILENLAEALPILLQAKENLAKRIELWMARNKSAAKENKRLEQLAKIRAERAAREAAERAASKTALNMNLSSASGLKPDPEDNLGYGINGGQCEPKTEGTCLPSSNCRKDPKSPAFMCMNRLDVNERGCRPLELFTESEEPVTNHDCRMGTRCVGNEILPRDTTQAMCIEWPTYMLPGCLKQGHACQDGKYCAVNQPPGSKPKCEPLLPAGRRCHRDWWCESGVCNEHDYDGYCA